LDIKRKKVITGRKKLRNEDLLLVQYYWGDKIKEDEMGRVCGMHVENCIEFW
jgi:hypothetical protein